MHVYDLYIFGNEENYIVTQWLKYKYHWCKFHDFINVVLYVFYIAYKSKMQLHTYKVASKWEKYSFVHNIHIVTVVGLQL